VSSTVATLQAKPQPYVPSARGLLQRKCACGNRTPAGEMCEACRQKRMTLQRRARDDERESGVIPPIVHDVLRAPGQALDAKTRDFMEPRFGQDFSRVRVHSDERAAQSARAVNALAYTVGRNVVFDRAHYAPDTQAGNSLLAHELAHVVQQTSSVQGAPSRIASANDALEGEADQAAQAALATEPTERSGAPALSSSSPILARRVRPENVTCRQNGLTNPDLTGDEVVAALSDADADAIVLARNAEQRLQEQLDIARGGDRAALDADFHTIMQEELGVALIPEQFRLVEQQIARFRRVRETLESGYLRYMCRGSTVNPVSLIGCAPSPCGTEFASSCPGNRLIVLCQGFWDTPDERSATILHEPFHIWFDMARHETNALRRADASCFESFALRAAGRAAFASCTDHTAG